MSDERRKSPRLGLVLILVAVLLVAAYPLSTGPIYWLAARGYISDSGFFVTTYFAPLRWIVGIAPPVGQWIEFYMELWGW